MNDCYFAIRAALTVMRNVDYLRIEADNGLTALAELEKAAAEPVAWHCRLVGHNRWIDCTKAHYDDVQKFPYEIETRPLYATPPPAPVAEMSEPVYLVATGETHEGAETYTRHAVCPPLCDAEKLYAITEQSP